MRRYSHILHVCVRETVREKERERERERKMRGVGAVGLLKAGRGISPNLFPVSVSWSKILGVCWTAS